MPDIYDQHAAAFANVSAFVVMRDGEKVATVAFKFPRDGAGRLYCYLHWLGLEIVRGYAGGYGYDKKSAAACDAAEKLKPDAADKAAAEYGVKPDGARPWHIHYRPFLAALVSYDGENWDRRLEKAGFTVWQAV